MSHFRVIKRGSPTPTPTPTPSASRMGMCLARMDYFSSNVIRQDLSRGGVWASYPSGANLPEANMNSARWPTTLPGADTAFQHTFQNPEPVAGVAPQVALTFTPGALATLTAFGGVLNSFNLSTGVALVTPTDAQPAASGFGIRFTLTSPGALSSLSAVPVGTSTAYGANYLAQMAAFTSGPLRPMDQTGVNGNYNVSAAFPAQVLTSANRNASSSGEWTWQSANDNAIRKHDGVPFEELVSEANAAGRDLWYNIHWNTDNTFIDAVADYAADNLTGNLYVELSNEVWNFVSGQQAAREAYIEGLHDLDGSLATNPDITNNWGAKVVRYVEKHNLVMDRFQTRFTAKGKAAKLLRVFAWQNAQSGYAGQILDYTPPSQTALKNHTDVYATAPYFGNITLGSSPARTTTDASAFFDAGFLEVDAALDSAVDTQTAAAARTNDRGNAIVYAGYEFGQSFLIDDATTNNAVQRGAQMYDLNMYAFDQAFGRLGNVTMNYYFNVGPMSTAFGSWGALEASYETDFTSRPKARALRDWILGKRKLQALQGSLSAGAGATNGTVLGNFKRRTFGSSVAITSTPSGAFSFVDSTARVLQVQVADATKFAVAGSISWTITETDARDIAGSRATTGTCAVVGGTQWDAPNSSGNYTLSGSNLIATRSSGSGDALVRGNVGHTTGTQSFTVTANVTSGQCSIGVALASMATSDWVGDTTVSIGWYRGDGNVYKNGAILASPGTYTNSDIIKPILKNGKLYFQKNGTDVVGNSTAETGGIDVSTMGTLFPAASANASAAFTADFTNWP